MKVSVFGLGYVGSVSAASFAGDGHDVVGVDVNPTRSRRSTPAAARSSSPGSTSCSRAARRRGTPARDDRHGRRRPVSEVVAGLRRHAEPAERQPRPHVSSSASASRSARRSRDKPAYHVVVVRSTVLPGTTHDVVIPALERDVRQEVRRRASACRSTPSSCAKARRSRTSGSRR